MSRLTVKKEDKYNIAYKDKGVHLGFLYDANDAVKDLVNNTNAVIEKLGKYEDIEEELGIEIFTLIKAMKEGFFDKDGEYHHFSNLLVSLDEIGDCYDKKSFNLKDYGKTWALSKEDFE